MYIYIYIMSLRRFGTYSNYLQNVQNRRESRNQQGSAGPQGPQGPRGPRGPAASGENAMIPYEPWNKSTLDGSSTGEQRGSFLNVPISNFGSNVRGLCHQFTSPSSGKYYKARISSGPYTLSPSFSGRLGVAIYDTSNNTKPCLLDASPPNVGGKLYQDEFPHKLIGCGEAGRFSTFDCNNAIIEFDLRDIDGKDGIPLDAVKRYWFVISSVGTSLPPACGCFQLGSMGNYSRDHGTILLVKNVYRVRSALENGSFTDTLKYSDINMSGSENQNIKPFWFHLSDPEATLLIQQGDTGPIGPTGPHFFENTKLLTFLPKDFIILGAQKHQTIAGIAGNSAALPFDANYVAPYQVVGFNASRPPGDISPKIFIGQKIIPNGYSVGPAPGGLVNDNTFIYYQTCPGWPYPTGPASIPIPNVDDQRDRIVITTQKLSLDAINYPYSPAPSVPSHTGPTGTVQVLYDISGQISTPPFPLTPPGPLVPNVWANTRTSWTNLYDGTKPVAVASQGDTILNIWLNNYGGDGQENRILGATVRIWRTP